MTMFLEVVYSFLEPSSGVYFQGTCYQSEDPWASHFVSKNSLTLKLFSSFQYPIT